MRSPPSEDERALEPGEPGSISPDDDLTRRLGWVLITAAVLSLGYGLYRLLHLTNTMIPAVIVALLAISFTLLGLKFVRR